MMKTILIILMANMAFCKWVWVDDEVNVKQLLDQMVDQDEDQYEGQYEDQYEDQNEDLDEDQNEDQYQDQDLGLKGTKPDMEFPWPPLMFSNPKHGQDLHIKNVEQDIIANGINQNVEQEMNQLMGQIEDLNSIEKHVDQIVDQSLGIKICHATVKGFKDFAKANQLLDQWCQQNCNHKPTFCPEDRCSCTTRSWALGF